MYNEHEEMLDLDLTLQSLGNSTDNYTVYTEERFAEYHQWTDTSDSTYGIHLVDLSDIISSKQLKFSRMILETMIHRGSFNDVEEFDKFFLGDFVYDNEIDDIMWEPYILGISAGEIKFIDAYLADMINDHDYRTLDIIFVGWNINSTLTHQAVFIYEEDN